MLHMITQDTDTDQVSLTPNIVQSVAGMGQIEFRYLSSSVSGNTTITLTPTFITEQVSTQSIPQQHYSWTVGAWKCFHLVFYICCHSSGNQCYTNTVTWCVPSWILSPRQRVHLCGDWPHCALWPTTKVDHTCCEKLQKKTSVIIVYHISMLTHRMDYGELLRTGAESSWPTSVLLAIVTAVEDLKMASRKLGVFSSTRNRKRYATTREKVSWRDEKNCMLQTLNCDSCFARSTLWTVQGRLWRWPTHKWVQALHG